MSDSSYGLTTFSPSGKLTQIEYAMQAVANGNLTIGIKTTDAVVLVAEKKSHPLVDESTVKKVFIIDDHIGATYSGIGPDVRPLIAKSRKICQEYKLMYHEPIPVSQCVREIAAIFQEFTQSGGVRPFGVSLLVAGCDNGGTHLYQIDPSGTFYPWKGTAIGKNFNATKNFLEKRDLSTLDMEGAINTSLLALKETFDGKMTSSNTTLGLVSLHNHTFKILSKADLQDHLDQIE